LKKEANPSANGRAKVDASRGAIDMRKLAFAMTLAAAGLISPAPAFAATAGQGQGQAVITVLPKGNEAAGLNIGPQNVELKVDGKQANVTDLAPAKGPNSPLELVILMDSSARTSLGTQLADIENFVKEMPNNTKIAIGYMENGRAAMTGPLSSDANRCSTGFTCPPVQREPGAALTSASPTLRKTGRRMIPRRAAKW
jgi:hypothetical protein